CDSSTRAGDFGKAKSAVARDRIRATDAQARERSGDIEGAIKAYIAVGSRLSAIRLRLSPAISDADRGSARNDLLAYVRNASGNDGARDAIGLFDQLFPKHPASEDLIIARAASGAGWSARAATAYSLAMKARLGGSADHFK